MDSPPKRATALQRRPSMIRVEESTMAGGQRTFELIPTSLVKSNGPKPPMTSKAAKKAHQLATRGPRVSRAEQRRRDAEELARQKKEYEREKAAAKSKAAREKKAAKEQVERELRRKSGIPEPSRFVRASQPTISMFVKNGKKRASLAMDNTAEESDATTLCDEEVVEPEELPAKKLKAGDESEDEYGGFPSFSQSELGVVLEEVESSAQSESVQNDRTKSGLTVAPETPGSKWKEPPEIVVKESMRSAAEGTPNITTLKPSKNVTTELRKSTPRGPSKSTAKEPPRIPIQVPQIVTTTKGSSKDFSLEDFDDIDDMAATQLLMEAADAAARFERLGEPSLPTPGPVSIPLKLVTISKPPPSISRHQPKHANPRFGEASTVKLALQERSANMPPPPLPFVTKEKRSISFAPSPPKPRTLPRLPPQPISKAPNQPPSATQAFLEDHLEDFFPSPSQEIRELLDDIDDLPTNTQIARELEPNLPSNPPTEDYYANLICTQDFVLSSQDILEITTPCPPPSKLKTTEQPRSTPTPLPTKLTRQPRRRFFEEKDEDVLHAAIQESKMLATKKEEHEERKPSAKLTESRVPAARKEQKELPGKIKRTFKRTLSNATDYGEDEFHDCEDELLALC